MLQEQAAIRQETEARRLLTADQLAEFRREGFLAIESPQISPTEIHWCRTILLSLIERNTGLREGRLIDLSAKEDGGQGVTPQLFRPTLYARELSRWSYRNTGLAIARQLLGPQAILSADTAVYKPCHIGGVTPWHQDEAYNDPQSYQEQITIWIAMFETTPFNGAMAFIPGSHKLGVLPHRLYGGCTRANSLECCGTFDPTAARLCTLPAGGITIHHGCTIHGAPGNKSDQPRLGYVLNYKNPPRARPELGAFSWNAKAASDIHGGRRRWLLRGGAFSEALRYLCSDADNRRYFIERAMRLFNRHRGH